jgi:hypothetical protein
VIGVQERLQQLLTPVCGSDAEVEAMAEELFCQTYCDGGFRGELDMHGGGKVVFFNDRFHHAFHTSYDRARNPYSKAKLALDRIERMRWIGAMISGEIPGTECWEIPPKTGRQHPRDRVLVIWNPGYVVWLWPQRNEGEWKFSSAYPVPPAEIQRELRRGGRKVWSVEREDAP